MAIWKPVTYIIGSRMTNANLAEMMLDDYLLPRMPRAQVC